MTTDRFLMRGKDIGLLLGISALLAIVIGFGTRIAKWDQAYAEVTQMKPELANGCARITVVEKSYALILSRLDRIEQKLDRHMDRR